MARKTTSIQVITSSKGADQLIFSDEISVGCADTETSVNIKCRECGGEWKRISAFPFNEAALEFLRDSEMSRRRISRVQACGLPGGELWEVRLRVSLQVLPVSP